MYSGSMDKQDQQGILLADHDIDEKSVVVVGDIHGCDWGLRKLLAQIIHTGCQVVFVGDLIDRGEGGRSVLTIVRGICEDPGKWGFSAATCLMGNHEKMALDAYCGVDFGLWLQNGGRIDDFTHLSDTGGWGWLNGLPLYYEHGSPVTWGDDVLSLLITHGSVQPGIPLESQDPEVLYWGRKIQGYSQKHLTVHGHTICQDGLPLEYSTPTGGVVRLDTGSYHTGIITAIAFREAQ